MTTITFAPTVMTEFVNWDSGGVWQPGTVPNGSAIDVVLPEITSGGDPYVFDVTISNTASYLVHSLSLTYEILTIEGALTVLTGCVIGPRGELTLGGELAAGSLMNAGFVDAGGTLTVTGLIENAGQLAGSALILSAATFQNTGELSSIGSVVTLVLGAGGLENLSGDVLSGGTYAAVSGATLDLGSSAAIAVDAADIILGSASVPGVVQGGPALIETMAGSLEATLFTIAQAGQLTLMGEEFSAAHALVLAGTLLLNQATIETPGLTIAPGGFLLGSGTVEAPVVDSGFIESSYPSELNGVGAALLFLSDISGTGTIEIAPYFPNDEYQVVTSTIELAGTVSNDVTFGDFTGSLVLDHPAVFSGTIEGFSAGQVTFSFGLASAIYPESDTVILPGVSIGAITGSAYVGDANSGTLILQEQDGSIAIEFAGSYALNDFIVQAGSQVLSTSPPSVVITDAAMACFRRGTGIATSIGAVQVEALSAGDDVVTSSGRLARVAWVGHRRIVCARHPHPHRVWPIRISAHAFADGAPARDLWLSPDHAVCVAGVLVPIGRLANGTSIVQVELDEVEYWHVELDRHDVLLAEGMAAESFLDTGNRSFFAGATVQCLHDAAATDLAGEAVWEASGCLPLRIDGAEVRRIDRRLRRRAGLPGSVPANGRARIVANPARLLDAAWYLATYQDVAAAGISADVHFARWGRREGRLPCPGPALIRGLGLIDPLTCAVIMADVVAAGLEPAEHYCAAGWREGRRPNMYFDPAWYRAMHGLSSDENPLLHYIRAGEAAGLPPGPNFDPLWYRRRNRLAAGDSALAHYLLNRRRRPLSPVPDFDAVAYARQHAASLRPGRDAYAHVLANGREADARSRMPSPSRFPPSTTRACASPSGGGRRSAVR